MRDLIYYVATSVDGFISGPNEDISGFVAEGNGINQYLSDLQHFDTVIMGRKTYEFGYRYGLKKGKAPYTHMKNYIITNSTSIKPIDKNLSIIPPKIEQIKNILKGPGEPIYLCGGSVLASWLLKHKLITHLKIKFNPFVQGSGTPLFGSLSHPIKLKFNSIDGYDHGLQIITYEIDY